MFSLGTPEIIVILAVALLVFGPKKLPEIGKSIGEGLRELRKACNEITNPILDEEPKYNKTNEEIKDDVTDSHRNS